MPATVPDSALPTPHALFAPLLRGATGIVVAVSGGPDSMALLHLMAKWNKHPLLNVATVDHGLRVDAAAEARMVADYTGKLGLSHTVLTWPGSKPKSGIQEAAREMRYQLLCYHALQTSSSHIVTAHHADDQAETVLLRLLAGSGIAGLAGMDRSVNRDCAEHVRPLLDIPKAALVSYCADNDIPFVTDPSNADTRFGRTRVRQLMTELAKDGLSRQRLCRLSERAARADEALQESAGQALSAAIISDSSGLVHLDWNKLSHKPAEIRLRVLMQVIDQARSNAEPLRLERLEALEVQLSDAHHSGKALRRSIADQVVALAPDSVLSIMMAPPRKRGMASPSKKRPD